MAPDIEKIDALPPLREIIAAHGLSAQKALGQNFLLDQNITDKIVRHVDDLHDTNVFEIGPGPGGLTRSLLRSQAQTVIAVEFDHRAVAALESLHNAAHGRLEIIEQDALQTDLTALASAPRAIVANLPYNIATPLIIGWLAQIRENPQAYQSMTLMVQKEVAQRMTATPNTKAYGRLSVLCQWLCDVKMLFDLSPSAFTPPPKVTSTVVQFVPKMLEGAQPSFKAVEAVTEAAFGQRRKMIRSSLKAYLPSLERLDIDSTLRAENLMVETFIALARD